jgi:hypothetical protein
MSNKEDSTQMGIGFKGPIENQYQWRSRMRNESLGDPQKGIDREPDFELKLTEIDVTSGSIPITWCLSKEWLENNNIRDYWVLFIVAPPTPNGKNAEWRGYAKLSDMMAYITFYRPGKNRVYARLSNNKDTVKEWMSRYEGQWKTDYIGYPSYSWEIDRYNEGKWEFKLTPPTDRPCTYLDLDMPKECFAAEPWEFEKTWVNWLWSNKAIDQCEFRKRRMFAYSIQPFLFIFVILLRYIVAFSVSIVGCRKVNYSPLWMPFTTSLSDIVQDIDGTYLVIKNIPEPFSYAIVPIVPLTLISVVSGFFLEGLSGIWLGLVFPLGFLAILGVVFLFCVSASSLPILNWIGNRWDAYWTRIEEDREARWKEWEAHQRQLMMCSTRTRITSIRDLPKAKRTVRLRFQGLKSMVCKPFSK